MKQNDNSGIEKLLINTPDNLIRLIKESVYSKNFNKKQTSRSALVKMGKTILPQMNRLVKSEEIVIRMEAAKILELIANRLSIPVFISLLDDAEFDVRWIAAEGLIKIGRRSIRPILKSVRDGGNSILYNERAHHVLITLLNEDEKNIERPLLLSLENHQMLSGTAPSEASSALETIRKIY